MSIYNVEVIPSNEHRPIYEVDEKKFYSVVKINSIDISKASLKTVVNIMLECDALANVRVER